jgi:hypothetical protein
MRMTPRTRASDVRKGKLIRRLTAIARPARLWIRAPAPQLDRYARQELERTPHAIQSHLWRKPVQPITEEDVGSISIIMRTSPGWA